MNKIKMALSFSVALIMSFVLCSCGTSVAEETTEPVFESSSIEYIADVKGIQILDVFSGDEFIEGESGTVDGKPLSVLIYNSTDKPLQYMLLTAKTESGDTLTFHITTIPSKSKCVVQEKTGKTWNSGMKVTSWSSDEYVYFPGSLDCHTDILTYRCDNGVLAVTNTSSEDITGDVVVYYKNVKDGVLFGGITYRVTLSGGIKKGTTSQKNTGHFDLDSSKIMYVEIV